MPKKVITRFPPSPTGLLQMGNVRTAIYNYLFAKHHGGQFLFRIEDTDKDRSASEYEVEIVENLHWLGLEWDNPVFTRQSERSEVYNTYLKKLVDENKAYISNEKQVPPEVKPRGLTSPRRDSVIRFKNPNKKVVFTDLIRGDIEFDTTDLGDFVIAKSLTEPIYHMAAVIDDFESGITHIIRGEDHISNTPRQILIQEAIGAPRPLYAHLPLILDSDRSKLSKRKQGEKVSLKYYISQGFLPQAVINYLALVGWNPGTEQEIFSLDELIKVFDISKVQKSGAIFNEEKMRWINKQHIERLPKAELYARIQEIVGQNITGEKLEKITQIAIERIHTFGDLKKMKEDGEFDYIFDEPEYSKQALLFKGKGDFAILAKHLEKVISLLEKIPETTFTSDTVKNAIWDYASEVGRGDVLWPMRFALSGKEKSPDPFLLSELLGRETSLRRLQAALKKVS
jgi:glutamyl-tRNA synthetase